MSGFERMLETAIPSLFEKIMSRFVPGVTVADLHKKAEDFFVDFEKMKQTVEMELRNEYDQRLAAVEPYIAKLKEMFPELEQSHTADHVQPIDPALITHDTGGTVPGTETTTDQEKHD